IKAKEEQQRIEEERKQQEEIAGEKLRTEQENQKGSLEKMDVDPEGIESSKGKEKVSEEPELPAYVVKMQEDIAAQNIKIDSLVANQKEMSSQLATLISLMTPKT
ncbi:hypothetical protein A2U01_0025585, partial [Trifolium medium]|nr:hypothetical protein [Trifolium medium]